MTAKKYSYVEPKQDLNARISAHAKYSNFNLHEWIKNRFPVKSGDCVWDLGCGNGNYTQLFWDFIQPSGYIIGMDKNEALIEEAKSKFADLPQANVQFHVQNFDEPLPEFDAPFQWVFAIYSLYYTQDSQKLLQTIKEKLAPGGQFVVIGPGPENTKDLMAFNYKLAGKKPDSEHVERIERIAKEFKPLFYKMFSEANVSYEEIDSVMEFPDYESYSEYYMSTLLWRQSVKDFSEEKIASIQEKMKMLISGPARIKKQMSCLTGRTE